jgi:tetratricopeptide (TPR) repeat protein
MRSYGKIPACCIFFAIVLAAATTFAIPLKSNEPHWIRVDSEHFSVLTDVDHDKAQVVLARFEQMRALFGELLLKSRVNMPQPVEIIAFKTAEEYEKVAPSRTGEGLGAGFYVPGDGRDYFVLNLAQPESWRAVSYNLAHAFLNFNYPPAQPWFDDGFAEYFASARLGDTDMRVGGDPEASLSGPASAGSDTFFKILSTSNWMTLPELFAAHPAEAGLGESRETLFYAQSWMVMHYLIDKDKLSDAGTYLGLVEIEKLPTEDAIQKAFGMNSAQLEKEVKDYFQTLVPGLQAQAQGQWVDPRKSPPMPAPLSADQVGATPHDVAEPVAAALIAEMELRVPERREQAKLQLQSLIDDPKGETAIAHRALGWYYLQKKDYAKSQEELIRALALDQHDIWTHFYLAAAKDREAQASGQPIKGVANMIQDLHVVLDWYPEFGEADYMLAKADLIGGGTRAATDAIRAAIKLNPRNESYLLTMAQIYEAGNNWEAANALLQRLAGSTDSQVASAAQKELHDLPYQKKYGVTPQESAAAKPTMAAPATTAAAAQKPVSDTTTQSAQADNDNDEEAPAEPQFDRRKTEYLKGKLVAVDCSQPPVAVLTIASGRKTLKMRTEDYKSLVLIGADTFSCDWKDLGVSVNYKAGGKTDGDLVSLEIH